MKLIKEQKNKFYKDKWKQNVAAPKKLWKALKSLACPVKKVQSQTFSLKTMTK